LLPSKHIWSWPINCSDKLQTKPTNKSKVHLLEWSRQRRRWWLLWTFLWWSWPSYRVFTVAFLAWTTLSSWMPVWAGWGHLSEVPVPSFSKNCIDPSLDRQHFEWLQQLPEGSVASALHGRGILGGYFPSGRPGCGHLDAPCPGYENSAVGYG